MSKRFWGVIAALALVLSVVAAGCGGGGDSGSSGGNQRRLRHDQHTRRLDRPGGRSLPGRARRLPQGVSERHRQVQVGEGPGPGALDIGAGRQPAGRRGAALTGPDEGLRKPRRPEADRVREGRHHEELLCRLDQLRHRQRQALRPLLQGSQQVDRLVQRPLVRGRGSQASGRVGGSPQRREDDRRGRHARLLDRRRRRLDAHRPLREHLSADGRAGQVRPARRRTRSRGPMRR